MTLLITGFDAFGGWSANPTAQVASAVASALGLPHAVLPVDLVEAPRALEALCARHRPAASLHLGLSGSAPAVQLERAALNVADFDLADASGRRPRSEPLVPGAPDGLMTRVDLHRLRAAVPGTVVSNSAGTYVCNALYFHALLASQGRALFVHLPPTPGLRGPASGPGRATSGPGVAPAGSRDPGDDGPSMDLGQQVRAIEAIARYLLATLEPAP